MLHTKSQGHSPYGSGEEDFYRAFTIYRHGGHLGPCLAELNHLGNFSRGPSIRRTVCVMFL